jgi:hypothetical protein
MLNETHINSLKEVFANGLKGVKHGRKSESTDPINEIDRQ